MSDIEEFSSRIMAAMDRVSAGLETLASSDTGEVDRLTQALDDEKKANADLAEQVRVLGARHEQAAAEMEAKAVETQERLERLDIELQQLRKANDMLFTASDALRAANAEGVGDPSLIDQAMAAELEAMHAMRKAQIAEADEIIAGLMPLLNASTDAGPAEEVQ